MTISRSRFGPLGRSVVLATALCASALAYSGEPATSLFGPHSPSFPKVPFGNKPCQSLSANEERSLGLAADTLGKSDRAPANLPFDNICTYRELQVGYMTEIDYRTNMEGNRSSSRTAPADLPGAFYDRQGGLWFAKNGYYVVLSHSHQLSEPAARIIVGKL
jgi:hypothetical protein